MSNDVTGREYHHSQVVAKERGGSDQFQADNATTVVPKEMYVS